LALGKKITHDWVEAKDALLEQGWVNIGTGGGLSWNLEVAKRLSESCNKKVLFIGPSPDYNDDNSIYRFSLEAKNNRQASALLESEY
jgi:tRNA A37 threonylcarbamoyltransferase TsaD